MKKFILPIFIIFAFIRTLIANQKEDPTQYILWGWGNDEYGAIGNITEAQPKYPVKIPLKNLKEISAKGNISVALDNESKLWIWGDILYYGYPCKNSEFK